MYIPIKSDISTLRRFIFKCSQIISATENNLNGSFNMIKVTNHLIPFGKKKLLKRPQSGSQLKNMKNEKW